MRLAKLSMVRAVLKEKDCSTSDPINVHSVYELDNESVLPAPEENMFGLFDYFLQQAFIVLQQADL